MFADELFVPSLGCCVFTWAVTQQKILLRNYQCHQSRECCKKQASNLYSAVPSYIVSNHHHAYDISQENIYWFLTRQSTSHPSTHPHIHTHSVDDRVYVPSLLLLIPPCLLTSKHRHRNHTYLILTYQQLGKEHNYLHITFWVHMLCACLKQIVPPDLYVICLCHAKYHHNIIKSKRKF